MALFFLLTMAAFTISCSCNAANNALRLLTLDTFFIKLMDDKMAVNSFALVGDSISINNVCIKSIVSQNYGDYD